MASLVPCPTCQRHVRTDEAACPFCGSTAARVGARPERNISGLSRAMVLAGATVLAACGKETVARDQPEPPPARPPASAAPTEYAIIYGAPPVYGPVDPDASAPRSEE